MQRRSSTCSLPAALLTDQPCPSPTLADHHGSVKRSISGYNLAGRGSRPNSDCLDETLYVDHAILHAGPFLNTAPSETPPLDNISVHSDTEIPPVQDASVPVQSRFQRKGAVRMRHIEDSNIIAEQANHISAEDLVHLQQQQLHKPFMAAPPPMAAIVPHMTQPMHFPNHPHPQNPNWATHHIIPVSRPAIIPHNMQYQLRQQPGQPMPQFATGINGLPPGGMIRPFPPQQIPFVPNHIQPPGPAAGFSNQQFPPRGNGNTVMCCNCGLPGHNSAQCCHTTPDSQSKCESILCCM